LPGALSQIPACGINAPDSSENAHAGQRKFLVFLVVDTSCRFCSPVQCRTWRSFHHLRRRQFPVRQTARELCPRHQTPLAAAIESLVEQSGHLLPIYREHLRVADDPV